MLVLTRKSEEAIVVGRGGQFEHLLKITVLGIGKGAVRLGFEVDSSVPIHRWEVWQKIQGINETRVSGEILEPMETPPVPAA